MRRVAITIVVILMAIGNGMLYSQRVNEDAQAQLILKLIRYDRNFGRYGDPIKIGVTNKSVFNAFKRYSKDTVKGKGIIVEMLKSVDEIPDFHVIYVGRSLRKDLDAVCAKAIEKKILMFSSSYGVVEKSQAAVAFRMIGKQAKIVLNVKTAKEQGADFPADLLRLTVLVGNLK